LSVKPQQVLREIQGTNAQSHFWLHFRTGLDQRMQATMSTREEQSQALWRMLMK
jgi:hypothetical protein